jgi:hypothetical protein
MGLKSYLSMLRRTCLHFAVYTALLLSPALSAGQSAYFPERALGQDAWETKFKTDWYSKFLTAFNDRRCGRSQRTKNSRVIDFCGSDLFTTRCVYGLTLNLTEVLY